MQAAKTDCYKQDAIITRNSTCLQSAYCHQTMTQETINMIALTKIKGLTLLNARTLLDNITKIQPNAKVYVMSTIPVSAELSARDGVYNNPGIDGLNLLVRELCDAYGNVTYLDVADAVSENGVLPDGVSTDGIHYNKEFSQKIMDYIRANVDL